MQTKSYVFLLSLFLIAVLFQNCHTETNTETTQTETPEVQSTSPAITPPLEGVNVPFQTYQVRADEAQVLEFPTGSSIEIPKNAFVDAAGNPVTEAVTIRYREFHDAADILASGIPMKVQQANGEAADMQSAGMFEIKGEVQGQPVFIAEDKNVQVNMASYVNDHVYDFWAYDEEEENWIGQGPSTAETNENKQATLAKIDSQEKSNKKPLRPVKFDKNKPVMNFDINYKAFPELEAMQGIMWQYAGNKPTEDPMANKWIFKEEWDFAALEPTAQEGQYRMKLRSERKEFSTSVVASQKGNDFEEALATYKQNLKEYQNNMLTLNERKEYAAQQADFLRSFRVQGFGVYNYDLLVKYPESLILAANFDFGIKIPNMQQMVTVFLVTQDGRSVVKYGPNTWNKFVINPNMDNRMVAILPGNRIATFSQQDFDEQMNALKQNNQGSYTFKMKVKEQGIFALSDVKAVLETLI